MKSSRNPSDGRGGGARRALAAAVLIAVLGAPAAGHPADAPETAGVVRACAGDATVTRDGAVFAAAVGVKLRVGDILATGPDGSLGVILRDNSTLAIGPESTLVIREFLFAPADGKLALLVRLSRGTLAWISGVIAKLAPGSVRFETPTATIGVRGTHLALKAGAPASP